MLRSDKEFSKDLQKANDILAEAERNPDKYKGQEALLVLLQFGLDMRTQIQELRSDVRVLSERNEQALQKLTEQEAPQSSYTP
jgi:hypothetical protein